MENNKCVYVHKDADGIVRYVGSGTLQRANQTYAKSNRGENYKEYVNKCGKLDVEIVYSGISTFEAINKEKELYYLYIDTLLNHKIPSEVRVISKEDFSKFFYYDPTSITGLRWKIPILFGDNGVRIKADTEAGCLSNKGYYRVSLNCVKYFVHRVIAILHDLDIDGMVVDHIDRDKTNNKIENLRVVTQQMNNCNKNLSSNNKSGITGVSFDALGKYVIVFWSEEQKRIRKYFKVSDYLSLEDAVKSATEYCSLMKPY